MTDKEISDRLQVALLAANRAGAFVLEAGKRGGHVLHRKQTNDFVTETDKLAEELIISIIKEHFPADAVFGEETGSSGKLEHGRWIIDPIDGTTNFFRSLPNYTISIAWEMEPFKPLVVLCSIRGKMSFSGQAKTQGLSSMVSRFKSPNSKIIHKPL